jgi:polar amino acid transport system substrate-binding protein
MLPLLAGTPLAAQSPLPERLQHAGVLRWGADAEGGAPFVFLDPKHPEQGEVGFEVDLARELGSVLGVRTERVQAPYETLVPALERGDFDVVLNGFEATQERRAKVRFSRPYYIFQQQLTVGPGSTGVRSLRDLVGRRVGVLGQSMSHQLVQAEPGVEAAIYESNVTAYQDLVNGRIAASLADVPIARALRPMFPALVDVGEPFHDAFYAMAVRPDDDGLQRALDAALVTLLANGTLERIYRKWDLWTSAQARLGEPAVANAHADAASRTDQEWGTTMALLGLGALRTLLVSVLSFALALALGLCIALVRLHGPSPLRWLALAYVELFRGTPILVQLLLLYYGLGQFEALRLDAFTAGVLGLGLNYAAYEAEIHRGALQAIPRGQREAAMALGLGAGQMLRHVVVPQAMRLTLAPSTNDFIALFKDSSIVMVISYVELTKQYQLLANASGRFVLLGLVTSALYLAMSLPLAYAARRFEQRLDRDRS